jgi:hypothetical protein
VSEKVFVFIDDGTPVIADVTITWRGDGTLGEWMIEVEYFPEIYFKGQPVDIRIMWPGSWNEAGPVRAGRAVPTKLSQPSDRTRLPIVTLRGDGPLELELERER